MQPSTARPTGRSLSRFDSGWLAVLLIAGVLGTAAAWRFAGGMLPEEGWHETAQAAVLLAGALAHGGASRWGRATAPGMLARSGLAMLCLTFALRELDIDQLGTSAAWLQLERVVRGAALLLWALYLVAAVRRLRRSSLRAELFARPWLLHGLVAAAGLLLIASWPFDKELLLKGEPLGKLVEESLELAGFVLLLAAARVRPD